MQDIAGSVSGAGTGVVLPSVKMVGVVTVRALDSLPLPFLLVVFIVCLALLQWPFPQSSPLLPTFTPPTIEKERLSPIFEKNLNHNDMYAQLQVYSLTSSSATGGQVPSLKGSGMGLVMPLPKGRNGRKGSKQLREWRNGLGVVEEADGELVTAEV